MKLTQEYGGVYSLSDSKNNFLKFKSVKNEPVCIKITKVENSYLTDKWCQFVFHDDCSECVESINRFLLGFNIISFESTLYLDKHTRKMSINLENEKKQEYKYRYLNVHIKADFINVDVFNRSISFPIDI